MLVFREHIKYLALWMSVKVQAQSVQWKLCAGTRWDIKQCLIGDNFLINRLFRIIVRGKYLFNIKCIPNQIMCVHLPVLNFGFLIVLNICFLLFHDSNFDFIQDHINFRINFFKVRFNHHIFLFILMGKLVNDFLLV